MTKELQNRATWDEEFKENYYYLKKRKTYSPMLTSHVRHIFETSYLNTNLDRSKNGIKGTYSCETVQTLWEGFFNGFRMGEDSFRYIRYGSILKVVGAIIKYTFLGIGWAGVIIWIRGRL